ncbi:MAG TPA: YegS/Rv2252/BmrU family lipid kinase [Candidatus Baltobacteraceae bacterium]|nr:YegS/Rv2252/BmrU family lipid kinase [Candidatus Baltobacteraceae bacterium]
MRALLVVNQRSRRGRAAAESIRAELAALGIEAVDSNATASAAFDCIVSGGGDGTLTRLIPIALERKVPIGIVPLGTFNDLARTLGVPADVKAACAIVAAGRTRAIDVARVNGVYYASEASIGVSSRIARLQTSVEKQRYGVFAVLATTLQAFRHSRPFHVEVGFDGRCERFRTIQLTVANSHRFGGIFSVADAAVDDGCLDLYSVEMDGIVQAFGVARAMLRGRSEDAPGLRAYRSARFSVRTHRPHRIAADGEPAGTTPATFEVLPKALQVFVPGDA